VALFDSFPFGLVSFSVSLSLTHSLSHPLHLTREEHLRDSCFSLFSDGSASTVLLPPEGATVSPVQTFTVSPSVRHACCSLVVLSVPLYIAFCSPLYRCARCTGKTGCCALHKQECVRVAGPRFVLRTRDVDASVYQVGVLYRRERVSVGECE
jgi:hypothetical protein